MAGSLAKTANLSLRFAHFRENWAHWQTDTGQRAKYDIRVRMVFSAGDGAYVNGRDLPQCPTAAGAIWGGSKGGRKSE